jgi:hypothetical protein
MNIKITVVTLVEGSTAYEEVVLQNVYVNPIQKSGLIAITLKSTKKIVYYSPSNILKIEEI